MLLQTTRESELIFATSRKLPYEGLSVTVAIRALDEFKQSSSDSTREIAALKHGSSINDSIYTSKEVINFITITIISLLVCTFDIYNIK